MFMAQYCLIYKFCIFIAKLGSDLKTMPVDFKMVRS